MKIALAQIHCQCGDLDRICKRISIQAQAAAAQGAHVLVTPAPLFQGILPGGIVSSDAYYHDVIVHLKALAKFIDQLNMQAIVPMVVPYEGAALFECMYLKEGRIVPMRSTIASASPTMTSQTWAPPIFEIEDTRLAITFDVARDASQLPHGVDMLIAFQVDGLKRDDPYTSGLPAVRKSHDYVKYARDNSIFLAYMASTGAYDESCYTGGSFIMDTRGCVIAQAACFEEDLLIQDVCRDENYNELDVLQLPLYETQQWTWEALRAGLRNALQAQNKTRVALVLNGDLSTSLLAALATDAIGPRNVFGLLVENDTYITEEQKNFELRRREIAREVAQTLHINLVVHQTESTIQPPVTMADTSSSSVPLDSALCASFTQMALERVALLNHAMVVSQLTKTDYALCGHDIPYGSMGTYAPFGDIWLSDLEFLANYCASHTSSISEEILGPDSLEHHVQDLVAHIYRDFALSQDYESELRQALMSLTLSDVDTILLNHIEKDCDAYTIASKNDISTHSVALLLRYVQMGEHVRRMLPPFPILSERSFSERCWPISFAWSDKAIHVEHPQTIKELARRGARRSSKKREEQSIAAMGEVKGVISDMLGIEPEQLDEMSRMAEESLKSINPEDLQKMESELRSAIKDGQMTALPTDFLKQSGAADVMLPGSPFFSQN